jgi:hypothetical protein
LTNIFVNEFHHNSGQFESALPAIEPGQRPVGVQPAQQNVRVPFSVSRGRYPFLLNQPQQPDKEDRADRYRHKTGDDNVPEHPCQPARLAYTAASDEHGHADYNQGSKEQRPRSHANVLFRKR